MEIVNSVLYFMVVILAVLIAAAVVLWILSRVFDGLLLALAGLESMISFLDRVAHIIDRAVRYVWFRKWRPEWKARERKEWEERLNARKRRERLEMLAQLERLKRSQKA